MAYEGYVELSSGTEIRGWVYDNAFPNTALDVEILCGDKVLATIAANQFRQDLLGAGKGMGMHGFTYKCRGGDISAPLSARLPGKRWLLPPPPSARPAVSLREVGRLAHSLEYGFPVAAHGFSAASDSADELTIVARIIAAYHRALADDPQGKSKKSDLWTGVGQAYHRPIIKLLHQRDVKGVAEYLRQAHDRGITFGITQGDEVTGVLRARADARQMVLAEYLDYLASLGEFLGVLDVESAEQHGQWGENLHRDPAELVAAIKAQIGVSPVPPQVVGAGFGLATGEGVLMGRDLLALYAALRLRDLARDYGVATATVCEIGGGLGGLAYFANRLGIAHYTIIDLPLISVLQGYFLLRALPGVDVCLYGEQNPSAAVSLLPTWCFEDATRQYDFLVNQDSIPEMHADYALGYMRQARRNVRQAFLSINQEARAPQSDSAKQSVVRDLAKQAGGLRPVYRFRHWLRAGYVEELFAVERV